MIHELDKTSLHEPPQEFHATFYFAGGTLNSEAPSYVERKADRELYHGLLRSQFCYVLTARQMGKSSLMVRTVKRLREAGVTVAVLDLTALGQNVEVEQWYRGLLHQLGQRLKLEEKIDAYWSAHSSVGPLQRWIGALRDVVLPQYQGSIVIFIDEIDMVQSLSFSADEFFAGIRQCYNERAEHTEMQRLSFCFLGVAAPTDLIRDSRMTPFNIGIRIQLEDFTHEEAMLLARGLQKVNGEALLRRVLFWTGGHPYLTQLLCLELARDSNASVVGDVDKTCSTLFLSSEARVSEVNLVSVRERLLRGESDLAALLDLYDRIRRRRQIAADNGDPLVNTLQLAGIVRTEKNRLKVRNRIYYQVFDHRWIEEHKPEAEKRRQQMAYRRGLLRATLVGLVILAAISGSTIEAFRQRRRATNEAEASRRLLYDRQMGLAQQEWDVANVDRVKELLQESLPRPGQLDLRGFEWFSLWRDTHLNPPIQDGRYPIKALSVDKKGKVLFAAELLAWREKTNQLLLRTIDLASKREIRSFRVPYDTGFDLIVFTPDGQRAVLADPYADSAGELATATLWNLKSGHAECRFSGHRARLSALAISADGKQLASGDTKGLIKLWSVASCEEKASMKGEAYRPRSLAFSPNGTLLAVADETLLVKLWNTQSRVQLRPIISFDAILNAVAFLPGGQSLLTASKDGNLQVWDFSTGKNLKNLSGHSGFIESLSFSPNHKFLATGSYDRTVRIWSVETGKTLQIIKGHGAAVNSLAWSANGEYLFTGSADTTIKRWDIRAAQQPILPTEKVTAYLATAFTSQGDILALGVTAKNKTKVWNLSTGQEVSHLEQPGDHILSAVFSPDKKLLATGDTDNFVKLWNVGSGHPKFKPLQGHTAYVFSVTFSPDGKLLVSGGKDQKLRLWEVSTGQQISVLQGDVESSWRAVFSPDGRYLASADRDGGVKLWDISSRQALRSFRGHSQKVTAIAFSPDGKRLVTGGDDSSVRLWDVSTGRQLKQLGLADRMQRAVFSPDGKRLVTGGVEGTIKFWDMLTDQELLTLRHGFDEISSVTFADDGLSLVTSSMDGTISLLRAAKNSPLLDTGSAKTGN